MGHHQVVLCHGQLDLEAHLGELLSEALHELDERLEAIWGLEVVLDVVRTALLLCSLGGLSLVERHIVVGDYRLLVLLGIGSRST